jgi:hypothetical protein
MASFNLQDGYFRSGLIFANTMASVAGKADLSDPVVFFSLAHTHGWGATTPDYVPKRANIYGLFRNSARHSESHS